MDVVKGTGNMYTGMRASIAPQDFTSGETAHDRAHRAIRELLDIALDANAHKRANRLLTALELLDQLD